MTNIRQQILEKIKDYETIIIKRHHNPDPDALGSQGGLQKILKKAFPGKNIYMVGEEVENLKFLIRMDDIDDSVYQNSLVIICDTATLERVSDDRYHLADCIIKIDHHPNVSPYGDVSWVDTSFSSTSEMIVDFMLHSDELVLNDEAARLLYAGIIGDTGRFLYNNTTKQTLDYSGLLLHHSFDPQEIYTNLYSTNLKTARLHGNILLNFEKTNKGVAYFKITNEIIDEFEIDRVDAANLVNVLSDIEDNHIWVFFVEYPDEIRVRIRSKNTPINNVARQFAGGGHPLASGASIQNWGELESVIQALDNLL